MKKKLSSSKKILISSILVGVLVISAIISLVAVLAASTQNINSKVSVSYIVDGVGAKVSANYYIINPTSGSIAQTVAMTDSNSDKELEFKVDEAAGEKSLEQTGTTVSLSSTNSKIVYEYKFTNTTEAAFKLTLNDYPGMVDEQDTNNMKVSYKSTGVKINNFASEFTDIVPKGQLVLGKGDTVYYYISSEVIDLNSGAQYKGDIQWILTHVAEEELSTLTLNNGDSEAVSLKYLADATVQLPHIKNFPSNGTKAFAGYKNESGTKMYDANGNSLASEASASGVTYTAEWMDAYIVSDAGELTGLTEEAKNLSTLNIPDSVSTINAGVFNNTNTSAKTINIPSSVTTIGESAFEGNTVVEEINFEELTTASYADDKLTSIGAKAFKGCKNLKELIIPEGVTSVGLGALQNLTYLEYLVLPSTLKSLSGINTENIPLNGTNRLKKLECHADVIGEGLSPDGMFISGLDQLYGFVDSEYYEDEDYYDTWWSGAYKPSTLTNVVINGGISIAEYAFIDDETLTSITLSESIKYIAEDAFSGCINLSEVHTPTLEAWLDLEHGEVFDNPYNLYVGGELITEIEIPSTITTIRSYAFSNCINIRSLKISSGLTTIEDYAFDRCQLESVHVSSLETWLNIDCYGDYDHPLRAGATLYINGVTPTEIEIPSTITHIKNAAFYGCKTLKTIKFHENIESIVGDAFYECVNLESVYIPSLEAWLNISFGDPSDVGLNPLDYADKLYVNNELLTELEILSGVTNIDFNQFGGYSGLTKVTLGDSVVSINEEAFAGCSNLESITLSKNITYISFYAFGNCNKLKDVYYDGTIDMWYDSGWGRGTEDIFMDCSQEITVYCTDGEIRI